jgi:hypothetical protein
MKILMTGRKRPPAIGKTGSLMESSKTSTGYSKWPRLIYGTADQSAAGRGKVGSA